MVNLDVHNAVAKKELYYRWQKQVNVIFLLNTFSLWNFKYIYNRQ